MAPNYNNEDDYMFLAGIADDMDAQLGAYPMLRAPSFRDHRMSTSVSARSPQIQAQLADRRALRNASVLHEVQTPLTGVPGSMAAIFPLGFPVVQFNNALGVTVLTTQSTPLKPMKGRRLTCSIARTAGASGISATITRLLIGATNILPSADGVDADSFAPTAVDMEMDFPPAGPGVPVFIEYTISAVPGAGETVTIATTLKGPGVLG